MKTRGWSGLLGYGVALALLALPAVAPLEAAGFGIFEQGARGMGMAGAFTAQADDPSAMFHNVGGLAFLEEREFQIGGTFITQTKADFTGAAPFPGAGARDELETLAAFPPHFYWVEPLNDAWTFGLALNSPFGLSTEWNEQFVGRFISTFGELQVVDLNPNLGWKLSPKVGIGFGPQLRISTVELRRHQEAVNPFTGQPADVARVALESDVENGIGWQFGFLHRYNESFSWGFHYKSKVTMDYSGDGRFTQIGTGFPQFDAAVRAVLPFGRAVPISTSIEFPDMASLGVAVALSPAWLVEVDYNWTGWSSVDQIEIEFTDGALPTAVIPQRWDDAANVRLGIRRQGARSEWRLGFVYDETPQPDETAGPLLPDETRNGFTVGYGRDGNRLSWDVALMYLLFEDRETSVNEDGFNGTYEITGLLLGITVGW